MSAPRGVVIGGSLGGPKALGELLAELPDVAPPVAVVLHRSVRSTETLRALVERLGGRPVREVEDDSALTPGVHLAPADYHLLVDGDRLRLSVDPKVRSARPSIDVLFHSAAQSWGAAAAAVLLTAASEDGVEGIRAIAERGGAVYVQDPDTAESPIAPAAALAALVAVGARPTIGSPAELGRALGRQLTVTVTANARHSKAKRRGS